MATIVCPMCKSITNFTTVHGLIPPFASVFRRWQGYEIEKFVAIQCNNEECGIVIGGLLYDGRVVTHWPREIATKTIEDVPDHIARAAEEAHLDNVHEAYRSAAILARAVVEATAKEKGITTGRLIEKIEKMRTQGLIRADIAEAAHEVRHLGNDMAHGDFVHPVSADEATEVLALMGEVLDEVFQSPARVQRVRAARQNRAQGPSGSSSGS